MSERTTIDVIVVEPMKRPKMVKLQDNLEAMQETVRGDIEEYMLFTDEVFVLSGFAPGSSQNIIKWGRVLQGNKILLLGNHDRISKSVYLEVGFQEVITYPILWNNI